MYVFIDTSILRGQQYNFASSQIRLFAEHAEELTLLLPDPIRREIERQMTEEAEKASKVWLACQRAPLLAQRGPFDDISDELQGVLQNGWKGFLGVFARVIDLDYSGVNVSEVMDWYEHGRAPFEGPKKKSEFPDALALAALLTAPVGDDRIAVVSKDKGFRDACALYPDRFEYFDSLGSLTERLLQEQETVSLVHELLGDGRHGAFADVLAERIEGLWFSVYDEPEGDVEEPALDSIGGVDFDVVKVDGCQVSVAFTVDVDVGAYVRMPDPDSWYRDPDTREHFSLGSVAGRVVTPVVLHGVVSISIDRGRQIYQVDDLTFDEPRIELMLDEDAPLQREEEE